MSFAARLKALRLRKNKSLQEVADEIGVSKPHLWELEMGKSRNPTKEVLEKLSLYFSVTVAHLLGETDEVTAEDEKLGIMFRELRKLDPEQRRLIEHLMEGIRSTNAPGKNRPR